MQRYLIYAITTWQLLHGNYYMACTRLQFNYKNSCVIKHMEHGPLIYTLNLSNYKIIRIPGAYYILYLCHQIMPLIHHTSQ